METKELKITIPEGQEIDWQESAKQEKIVLKKKYNKSRSWKEYYKNNCKNKVFEGIQFTYGAVDDKYGGISYKMDSVWQIPMNSELAEAFLTMMQLMSLRQEWIDNWEPDWSNEYTDKYCIIGKNYCNFEVYTLRQGRYALSFPTREMATDFMNTFKDLLKIAKPLI